MSASTVHGSRSFRRRVIVVVLSIAAAAPTGAHPSETDAWIAMGKCLLWSSRTASSRARPPEEWRHPDASLADCWAAVRADLPAKSRARAHAIIGEARAREGNHEEAVAHYRASIDLGPEAWTHSLLGHALTELGRFGDALQAYREALRLRPNELRAFVQSARTEAEREQYKSEAHGSMVLVHYYVGHTLGLLGRFDESLRAYSEAVRWAPEAVDLWGRMAVTASILRRPQEAISYWERALLIQPSYFDTRDEERQEWEKNLTLVRGQPAAPMPPLPSLSFGIHDAGAERASPRMSPPTPAAPPPRVSGGSGFVVSRAGDLLTAAHVVDSCPVLRSDQFALQIVAVDRANDVALVSRKLPKPLALSDFLSDRYVATFRDGRAVRQGEEVVAIGFPLRDLLGAGAKLTTGIISALGGSGADRRYQMTTPVQPGNSGGPLLDRSGNVIGLIVARLGARVTAEDTVDVPQNVNFAVPLEVLRSFLDQHGVAYQKSASARGLSVADVGERARAFTVPVECRE